MKYKNLLKVLSISTSVLSAQAMDGFYEGFRDDFQEGFSPTLSPSSSPTNGHSYKYVAHEDTAFQAFIESVFVQEGDKVGVKKSLRDYSAVGAFKLTRKMQYISRVILPLYNDPEHYIIAEGFWPWLANDVVKKNLSGTCETLSQADAIWDLINARTLNVFRRILLENPTIDSRLILNPSPV